MRKLVLKDKDGALTEADPKALRREALALKAYIESAPKREEQKFQYRVKLLPLVEAALNGTLEIPYKEPEPYNLRLSLEGFEPMLPQPFSSEVYSPFINRIRGSALCSDPTYLKNKDILDYSPVIIEQNGQRYQWVEFED